MTVLTYHDPRTTEGDPYEVADFAVAQALELLAAADTAVSDAYVMARNAELERQGGNGDLNPSVFTDGPEGRAYDELARTLAGARRKLSALRLAASWDPNAAA